MNPEMNNEEREIDLKDLFAALLHRWKLILIWMILFAVLVGGIMSYRDYLSVRAAADTSGAGYEAMVADMTEEQVSNTEQFYQRYINFKARVDETQKYINESAMMKLNANCVSRYNVDYYVESEYAGIIDTICSGTIDMDDYDEIARILGNGVDPHYVSELISMQGNVSQETYDIDTDKVGDLINGSVSHTYKGILHLSVTTNDRASGEKVAQYIGTELLEQISRLSGVGIEAQIKPYATTYTEEVDAALAEYQRTKTEETSAQIKSFNDFNKSAKDTLDESEYALLQYKINMEQQPIEHVHWKKWIVLGAAAGICLGVVVVVIAYLFSPQIKTVDELKAMYRKQELGIVFAPADSKVLVGRWFHQWAEAIERSGLNVIGDAEAVGIIASRIASIARDGGHKKVYLVTDAAEGYTKTILEQCVELLGESGITASFGHPVSALADLEALRESDAAVMVSTVKRSLPVSVQSGLTICDENHIPVIGNFIVYPQA